ncbi:MAG: type II secretion system F family protein [Methermicoccaceae archaeon]
MWYRAFSVCKGAIHRNEPRFEELKHSLKAARIKVPYDIYFSTALLVSIVVAGVAAALLALLFTMKGWAGYVLSAGSVWADGIIVLLVAWLVLTPVMVYAALLYPKLKARGRRSRIELTLPHAVTFMYAMSKSNMTLFDIFKLLAQHRDIYLEVSEEAEMIVREVEMFGSDLPTALRGASKSTPSKTFADFCENLITVMDSGSEASEFFATKSKQYLESAYQEQELLLKTLEMLAEAYVTAFVAGPIFLIVMLVTMGMLNMGYTSSLYYVLYLVLPIASVGMLMLLEIIMPAGETPTSSTPSIVHLSQFRYVPTYSSTDTEGRVRLLHSMKHWTTLVSLVKNPIKPFLDNHYRTLYITVPLACVLALWYIHSGAVAYEKLIVYLLVLVMLPLSATYEVKMFNISRVEKTIPRFLRSLANLSEIGLSLRSAVETLLHANFGVLQGEIRKMHYDMVWGASSTYALVRFENRVRTLAVQRAVTLITKASEVAQNIQSVLLIAAVDAEHNLQLKKERYNNTFVYVVTIYISFAVFLYTSFTMGTSFIPSLTGVAEGVPSTSAQVDLVKSLSTMFHTALILGLFSGLIAGKMSKGHVLYGIKHSIVFIIISYVMFTRFMGGAA